MAFAPVNKLTAERALDQIGVDATAYYYQMSNAVDQIASAYTLLAGMATSWNAAVTFVNDQAAANPGDTEWQEMKARKDMLVADFFAMRDKVLAVRNAAQTARDA